MERKSQCFTTRSVEQLELDVCDRYLWGSDIRGLGIKVTPTGRRAYLLQYRMGGREAAIRRQGIDPWVQQEQRRCEEAVILAFQTYGELFIERYLKSHWTKVGTTVSGFCAPWPHQHWEFFV